jgi:hypothetical protein
VKYSLILPLFGAIFVGCSTPSNEFTANHALAGHFHGEFFVDFSPGSNLVMEMPTTWYNERPSQGPMTYFSQMPPSEVKVGMTFSEVENILGRPVSHRGNRYCYYIR